MISRICELAHHVTAGHTLIIMSVVNRSLALTLAGRASCDWRTAERFLRGEAVKGLAAERLRAAATELGLFAAGGPLMISAGAVGTALDVAGSAGIGVVGGSR